MKLTFDANNTKVYDNILDQKTFNALFDFMNFVPMVHKRSRGEWNRVWGFNDGDILMANRYIWPRGKVKDFTYPEDCLTPFFKFVNDQIENSGLWTEEEKNVKPKVIRNKFSGNSILSNLTNFYMTDSVSRNSPTMSSCSLQIRDKS